MQDTVRFYLPEEKPFGVFCNYYPSPITIDGVVYPTTEHLYQCEKFDDERYREVIRTINTPNKSRELGHQKIAKQGYAWRMALNPVIQEHLDRGVLPKKDWEENKEKVMFKAVLAKFSQHPELATILLSTEKRMLIEASPRDSFWGSGGDGKGMNVLGKTLMKVRAIMRARRAC
jgi:ribA/ribD-fused uncharacterized protein